MQSAVARGNDIVIIDTAGRLHNKAHLMEELTKIKRVIKKVIPDAPHEVMLVLDGSTGQNAVEQAKHFTAAEKLLMWIYIVSLLAMCFTPKKYYELAFSIIMSLNVVGGIMQYYDAHTESDHEVVTVTFLVGI